MKNTISAIMPTEIELMGTKFHVQWFRREANRYVRLESSVSKDHHECDVTDLILEAILLGLEQEGRRRAKGELPAADKPTAYYRKVAANLVHQAARKSLRWHARNKSHSAFMDEECETGGEELEFQNSEELARQTTGLFKLFPVEELMYASEVQTQKPLAKRKA